MTTDPTIPEQAQQLWTAFITRAEDAAALTRTYGGPPDTDGGHAQAYTQLLQESPVTTPAHLRALTLTVTTPAQLSSLEDAIFRGDRCLNHTAEGLFAHARLVHHAVIDAKDRLIARALAQETPMTPPTPNLDQQAALEARAQDIGAFIDFLFDERGFTLCTWADMPGHSDGGEYRRVRWGDTQRREMIERFFGLDPEAASAERDAVQRWVTAQAAGTRT